ncbi:hypothetical protein [Nocardia altamirensis]|uniref:hypothetical protein n=1 Tax=Nocardia altamirensis TaxID=472158 RepID=UPI00083FE7BC|nr:hypothetical protein [Nocardia altamirensis]
MIAMILSPLMWVAAVTRGWRWWWSRSWVLGSTTIALGVVALHLTLNIPAAEGFMQAIAPMPNFSTGLRMVLFNVIAAATGALTLAVTVDPARVARGVRILGAIAAAGSLAALAIFVGTPSVPQVAGGFEFDQAYSHLPGYAEAGIAGALFPALLCPALMVMAARPADLRTVTGWSLSLLAAGLAAATVWAWIRLCYFVAVRFGGAAPAPAVFEVTRAVSAAGVLVIFAGVMLSPVVSWVRARRVLIAIGPMYHELVPRWPGVRRQSRRGSSADERASDRVTELLDALSLEVEQAGKSGALRTDQREVAAAVANWLIDGQDSTALDAENVRAAAFEAETDRHWALLLAQAYRARRREAMV